MWTLKCVKTYDCKPSSDATVLYSEKIKLLLYTVLSAKIIQLNGRDNATAKHRCVEGDVHIFTDDLRLSTVPKELWIK